MKRANHRRRPAPLDAPSHAYLPGFAPPGREAELPETPAGTPGPGWWVKRSETQLADSAGQPVGFKHQLMHGSSAVKSGTGADCARTFLSQAEFLNSSNSVPCNQGGPPEGRRDKCTAPARNPAS